MKRSGPKMLPCGTPTDTGREADSVLSMDVTCSREER